MHNRTMYIKIIVFIVLIKRTKCSIVIDQLFQNDVQVSDYCPEIGVCKDGSHVMCTHYDPNHKMGPTCGGVENATMTEDIAAMLIDIMNSVRSRAARGLATGYANSLLPRAYGMYRLQWDPELATLAQVWANQCLIQFDYCRATKKFPDPGQLASITRFVTSDWVPLSKRKEKDFFGTPGFNNDKIRYAMKSSVRSWYSTSEEIDSDIITDRNSSWSEDLIRNPYLQIIDGSVTHMGCGTSAFKEFRYNTQTTRLLYNVVRLICNFSSRVHDRRGIYNTEPPTKVEYTAQCGCPPGYDEDAGCLCYESVKNETKTCKKNKPEKLQVVVVPIFTVEDYPRAKEDLMADRKRQQELNKNQGQIYRRYIANRPIDRNFSTTSILELTSRKLKKDVELDKVKWDVAPRKDFSKSRNQLSNYLSKKRSFNFQNNYITTRQDKNIRKSLPITSIKPPKDNYIRRKTYNNWGDRGKYNSIQRKNTSSYIKASKDEDFQLLTLLNNLENEASKINVNKKDRIILNNGIRKIFSALKNSNLINNNRNIIYNKKTEKKSIYVPFVENHKLTIYEDLFKNISSRQRNLKPRNLSIFSTKYRNNTHLINSLTGKEFDKYIYKNNHRRNMNVPQRTKHIYCTDLFKKCLRSDEDFLSDNRRVYYNNRINDIRRKLKSSNFDYIKSGRGLKIRPTFEASHLQLRQTQPFIESK